MRPLNSHFADDALSTLDTLMKHSKETRVFRRANRQSSLYDLSVHQLRSAKKGCSGLLVKGPTASWTAPAAADLRN